MDAILNTKIARYLFGLIILMFGVFHFMNAGAMAGIVPSYMPAPELWVYLTGVAHIAAAVSIFINKQTRLAMALLAIMLVLFALMVHLPGGMDSMDQVMKDLAMACAAIFVGASSDE